MAKDYPCELHYTIEDIKILISCDCPDRTGSLASYLCLPACKDRSPSGSTLNLIIRHTDEDKLDEAIPLPGTEHLHYEKTLLADRPIPYCSYSDRNLSWTDFRGYGRSRFDRKNKKADVAIVNNNGISSVYTDILFGYNMLLSLLSLHGYQTVHASCVQINKRGILFTGHSGSGKSTAACAVMQNGHPVLADDRILLKKAESCEALAISDVIKVELPALERFFPELGRIKPLHQVENEFYYKVSATPPFTFLNETAVHYLMIFQRTGEAKSRIETINPARVVGDLFPVTMGNYQPAAMQNKFAFLMDFLETVTCCRVYFGTDMDYFSECISEFVERGSH
jgi:hypothetical protein